MKNENKLYELLNKTKTDFWEYDEVEVSGIEKQRLIEHVLKKKQPARRSNRTVLLLTATVMLLFAGSRTPWGQSVQAAANSFLESIQYSLADVFGVDIDETPDAALSVGQMATIGDAEVKLEDLLAFEDHLLLNVLVDLKEDIDEQRMTSFSSIEIYLNGELLHRGGAPSSGGILDEANNIHQQRIRIPLNEGFVLPEKVNLQIRLQDVGFYQPGYTGTVPLSIAGTADFTVETTAAELTKYTNVYALDYHVSVGELDYQVSQLSLHPIISYLTLYSPNGEQDYQVMAFRGVNEEGKLVVFEPHGYSTTEDEWKGTMKFSEELSEITTQELNDSEWIELQLHSAGHPQGEAHFQVYGEPFRIQLK